MLSHLKISSKLGVGFGALLVMLAAGSLFTTLSAHRIQEQAAFVREVRYAHAVAVIDLMNRAESVLTDLKSAADSATVSPLERAREEREVLLSDIAALVAEEGLAPETREALSSLETAFVETYQAGDEMAERAIEQDFLAYVAAQQTFASRAADFGAQAEQLRDGVSAVMSRTLEEMGGLAEKTVRLSLGLAVSGLIVGILLTVAISANIVRPMRLLSRNIEEFGRGNLHLRLHFTRRDEIGQVARTVDGMAEKLEHMVSRIGTVSADIEGISGRIGDASRQVDASARQQSQGVESTSMAVMEINASVDRVGEGVNGLASSSGESTTSVLEMSASIDEVAQNAENLAEAVEEVGSSITEMAASIRQVSDNAETLKDSSDSTASSVAQMDASIKEVEEGTRETAQITEAVQTDAMRGQAAVQATIAGMQEIRTAYSTVSQINGTLAEKTHNIGSILSVIDEVTDQTNLLALNAAIIAAQAGEHGRGFAVVAEEIRELADRTSGSTREIAQVIRDVQQEMERAVEAIRKGQERIDEGEELSRDSGEALGKIVEGVQEAARRADRIAAATVEQAQGSRMIREAIENVSRLVDQTAGATREQSKGSEHIMAAVERMKDLTLQVKTSTREQSHASRTISRSMESVNEMIARIREACTEQKSESNQISGAVNGIRDSARDNLAASDALKGAVDSLGEQVELLRLEMGAFRTGQEEPVDRVSGTEAAAELRAGTVTAC